jgi:glycerophosphoryl diester phosphodiesterase
MIKIDPASTFEQLRLPYPQHGIISHRGLSSEAPENTQASFIAAAQAGLSWVEFDVQRCASGEWVVFHDETLERTSNGRGPLKNQTFAQLKALDIGAWFDPHFGGERILSLAETLSLTARLGLHINVEVKFFKSDASLDMIPMATQIGSIIQQYWVPQTKLPPMISSFHLNFLKAFRQLYPHWPIAYLIENFDDRCLDTVQALGFSALGTRKESLLAYIEHSQLDTQIPLLVFTVNDALSAKRLFSAGVSAIFSDKAKLFR